MYVHARKREKFCGRKFNFIRIFMTTFFVEVEAKISTEKSYHD